MVKSFTVVFFWTKKPITMKLGYTESGTWVLSFFFFFFFFIWSLGLPWLFLWPDQIYFLMLLHGWKLIQHWVLLYFQVCSNSAYSQHSGEQYRTIGPLVFPLFLLYFVFLHFLWVLEEACNPWLLHASDMLLLTSVFYKRSRRREWCHSTVLRGRVSKWNKWNLAAKVYHRIW